MKKRLLFCIAFLAVIIVKSQELYTVANAASIANEANTTTGWSGLATMSSTSTDVQLGNFSIMGVSTDNNGRVLEYTFNAVAGTQYTIRIWAKAATGNTSAAFADWKGVSGFSTTPISQAGWAEYVFNVTATNTTPILKAWTSSVSFRNVPGNTIFLDNISILPAGAVTDTQAPTAVTGLSSSNITATSASLSWTASTDNVGVTNYQVFRNGVSVGTTGGATSFNATGLTPSTSYAFTVFASDAAGNISAVSNTANVQTTAAADTQAPTAVTGLAASNITATSANLSWTASTDNVGVTNYEVFRGGVSVGSTGGVTNFNATGLTPSTSYAFTVFARDAAGNTSTVSNTANVQTTASADTQAPTAVTGLAASNITGTSANLSWTASTDNVGVTNYEVFRGGVSVGATGGTTSYSATGLTPSTSYTFTVFARDAAGNTSTVSNTANVLTSSGGGEINYSSTNANLPTIDWQGRDLYATQNVGIGTTNTQGYRLAVAGNVVAEEIKVALQVNWPDFVFENDYTLPTLKEVEEHIIKNGYLINMPSASTVKENGIKLGEMNAMLLQKIEELTLYTIAQEKKIKLLEIENNKIEELSKRLLDLEQALKSTKE
tara:strand:- start:19120 stop:20940 length:1821 start_codon:yes stop_codon:yes gene_type:complete